MNTESTTTPPQRLTPERESHIRNYLDVVVRTEAFYPLAARFLWDLFDEINFLRADRKRFSQEDYLIGVKEGMRQLKDELQTEKKELLAKVSRLEAQIQRLLLLKDAQVTPRHGNDPSLSQEKEK